jgi:tetratricopeptide (TPR) repeat protein
VPGVSVSKPVPGLSAGLPRNRGRAVTAADRQWFAALILRSLALSGILWQFRLFAVELADTPVFAAALLLAFAAAWGLFKKKLSPPAAAIILILIPWAARALIAFPRFFVQGPALILDSLLLRLDHNNFVSLIPFYWAALGTYGSLRSRRFLRADILAADTLLVILFSIARTAEMEAYRWPVFMIAFFGTILFLQILAVMLSIPPEYRLRKKEGLWAGLVLFILILAGSALFIGPSQERALNRGGGLLEPKFFRFDFSQFLRLENEISMNDDLIFIVKKDSEDSHILLRRFVLSGYSKSRGFFHAGEIDERAHPQQLPQGRTALETEEVWDTRMTNQEYYLVNFDAAAFIAMKEPAEIIPFDTWDASSFSSAYRVRSRVSKAGLFDLINLVRGMPSPAELGLSAGEYAFYTDYGGDEEIAAYAGEITAGFVNYWEKVQGIYEWLKFGEYRYSLKPGIAPDGDQLKFFLFKSKKGYCSYYAFAMTILLRSLGIPARVAVGFFIDPGLNTFDYYPVRADMAHAWVEVRYPGYGWVEYDPTTAIVAEDEEFRPPSNVQDSFERLLREILNNHSRLVPREGTGEKAVSALAAAGRGAIRFIQRSWIFLCVIFLAAAMLFMRLSLLAASRLSRRPRRKGVLLWAHVLRRLALGGWRRPASAAGAEWAKAMDAVVPGVYRLYQCAAAARYAPSYVPADLEAMQEAYALFSAGYGKEIILGRRLLAWFLPPLALILPAKRKGRTGVHNGGIPALFLIFLLLLPAGDRTGAQDSEADRLFDEASKAQDGEFWERAIELYTEGAERFPRDIRFPWTLGDLYFSRGLYRLARDEYQKLDRMLPADPGLLYRLFQTSGHLNENGISAGYLERLLVLNEDNKEAVNHLGWMYYKLHRLKDAEELIQAFIERNGTDADISMTLGTIYADMFRYDDAKGHYLDAIERGTALEARDFVAVAHYNLAILESRFYRYAESFRRTGLSLSSRDRVSGRLIQGELFLRQLDISRAVGEFQEAYQADTSTLSKMDLAQIYQIAGRLEEARLYGEDSLNAGDLSWMLNYGIDPVQYRRDLHEILYKTYGGLEKTEAFMFYASPADWIRGRFRRTGYWFKASVHRRLFEKYSLLSANDYSLSRFPSLKEHAEEPHLDALLQYYNAFKLYPRRGLSYLRAARNFEVPLIPLSEPSYDAEEGILRKNGGLLRSALENLDPVWERDMIADVYAELARPGLGGTLLRTAAGTGEDTQRPEERLYALNRGALRQRGIRLPVELVIAAGPEGGSPSRRMERNLRRTLRRIGVEPQQAGSVRTGGARFRLGLTAAGDEFVCELYDSVRGEPVFRRSIPLASSSAGDLSAFALTLGEALFTEE